MIDLNDLRRVRFAGGDNIHAVDPAHQPRMTRCGYYVKLDDGFGRAYDKPIKPGAAVTCPSCLARGDR